MDIFRDFPDLDDWLAVMRSGQVPEKTPAQVVALEAVHYREKVTALGMWALVDLQWTKRLARHLKGKSVLEVMAGAGWLAKALSQHGVDIVATDSGEWDAKHTDMRRVYDVEILDGLQAVQKYRRDVLLCSWPPYSSDDILSICQDWPGTIVYIGEGGGGCNAPEDFFAHFRVEKEMFLPQWFGLHDQVMVGTWSKEPQYEED